MPIRIFEQIEKDTNISEENKKIYRRKTPAEKARLSHYCDIEYRKQAREFEYKLANKAQKNLEVHKNANKMLGNLKNMVDAWQESLGLTMEKDKKKNLESEFTNQKEELLYYGAIKTSAQNIENIFNDESKPLRLKYRLIYNCILNGNFTKWLKVLAFQYKYGIEQINIRKENQAVKVGKFFEIWKNKMGIPKEENPLDKDMELKWDKIAEIVNQENSIAKTLSIDEIRNKFSITDNSIDRKEEELNLESFHGVLDKHPWMQMYTCSRSAHNNLTGKMGNRENDMRQLTVKEVDDITEEEIEYINEKQRAGERLDYSKISHKEEKELERKLGWTQGSEDYSLWYGTFVTKEANKFKARMEAGISGSTDLMMHAAEYLGIKAPEDKKILRMGLAGWMIGGRDHSFYEVFKSAENYGVKFNIDENKIGSEYEDAENLTPLTIEEDLKDLDCKFPSYYYSIDYLDTIKDTKVEQGNQTKQQSKTKQRGKAKKKNVVMTKEEEEEIVPYVEGLENLIQKEIVPYIESLPNKNNDNEWEESCIKHKYREMQRDTNYIFLANRLPLDEVNNIITTSLKNVKQEKKYKFLNEVKNNKIAVENAKKNELIERFKNIRINGSDEQVQRLKKLNEEQLQQWNFKSSMKKNNELHYNEKKAIFKYTGKDYEIMNKSLEEMTEEEKEEIIPFILAATSGLTKLPVYNKDETVYRICDNELEDSLEDKMEENKKILNEKQNTENLSGKNFVSTAKSLDSAFIQDNWGKKDTLECITNIKTGHDISDLSSKPDEEEVLFEPGARFQIQKISLAKDYDGRIPDSKKDKDHVIVEKEEI